MQRGGAKLSLPIASIQVVLVPFTMGPCANEEEQLLGRARDRSDEGHFWVCEERSGR
jgi:hypothetical protein